MKHRALVFALAWLALQPPVTAQVSGRRDRRAGAGRVEADSVVRLLPLDRRGRNASGIAFKSVGEVAFRQPGNGAAVVFDGGGLVGTGRLTPAASFGAFTVHLHVWMAKNGLGNVFFCGSDTAGIRLFTRMAGTDPARHAWDRRHQNYLGATGQTDSTEVLEAEISLDNAQPARRKMRVGVPLAMIGNDRWHDVVLRFNGPKLDFFVDGVLVDEEWPVGRVEAGTSIRFGAPPATGTAGFRGQLRTAAFWPRALSDAAITRLCGGEAAVARRTTEILGPQKTALHLFTPRGHNTWVGDVVCFYYDGTFHLFYLRDRRHSFSKFGCGAHSFAHVTSRDLRTWQQQPDSVPITAQWETLGTGTVVFWQGTYYLFYGLHSDRVVPAAREPYLKQVKRVDETARTTPTPIDAHTTIPVGTTFATSRDGVHFVKSGQLIHPSQNPSVFVNEAQNRLDMLAGYGLDGFFSSTDLLHWQREEAPLVPVGRNSPCWNTGECQSLFEWNGFHYVLAGRTGFFMAKERYGPYQPALGFRPTGEAPAPQPRWDPYDGLFVPMVAPFANNRRILAGWLQNGGGWAGTLLFRELLQEPDGTLSMRWPPEMVPPSGPPLTTRAANGRAAQSHTLTLEAADFGCAELTGLPANAHVRFRVEAPSAEAFGVDLFGQAGYQGGVELQFIPAKQQAQWGTPQGNGPSPVLPTFAEIATKGPFLPITKIHQMNPAENPDAFHVPFVGRDFAIAGVEGLTRSFTVDILVKQEKNGAFVVDACIDGRRTLATYRTGLAGNRLALFVRRGTAQFKDVTINPLTL